MCEKKNKFMQIKTKWSSAKLQNAIKEIFEIKVNQWFIEIWKKKNKI